MEQQAWKTDENGILAFGSYPQKKVADKALATKLEAERLTSEKDILSFNGERYAYRNGSFYAFAPIEWKLFDEENGLLVSCLALEKANDESNALASFLEEAFDEDEKLRLLFSCASEKKMLSSYASLGALRKAPRGKIVLSEFAEESESKEYLRPILFLRKGLLDASTSAKQRFYGDFEIEDGVLYCYRGKEKDLALPEGIVGLADYCFEGDARLAKVAFPKSLKRLGQGAFQGCKNLKEVLFAEDRDLALSPCAFADCPSLEKVALPEGLDTLPYGSFANDKSLEEVHLPSSLRLIDGKAFSGCLALKSIELPEGLSLIWGGAFSHSGLRFLTLPSSLKVIGVGAFADCLALSLVSGGESASFGEMAFSGCPRLAAKKQGSALDLPLLLEAAQSLGMA